MNKANDTLLSGIINNNHALIYNAIQQGAPYYDQNKSAHALFLKKWYDIIKLNDIGIIELIYSKYPYKNGHKLNHLLSSICINKKDSFDFFLNECVKSKADLNSKFGILLSNTCKMSPLVTYFDDESYSQKYVSDYCIQKLLNHNIDLNITTTHPLVILSKNNNFHSWKLLYQHIRDNNLVETKLLKKYIIHSLFNFLNNNSFLSNEIQFFFNEFDKKFIFSAALKKISHPSYKGNELELFCIEMFNQEPDLFLEKSKKLGINNEFFKDTIQKIFLFDKLNNTQYDLKFNSHKSKTNKI